MMGVLISGRQIISSPSIKVTISSKNPNVKREYLRTVVHHSLWAVMTQSPTKKDTEARRHHSYNKHRCLSLSLPAIVCRPPFLTESFTKSFVRPPAIDGNTYFLLCELHSDRP